MDIKLFICDIKEIVKESKMENLFEIEDNSFGTYYTNSFSRKKCNITLPNIKLLKFVGSIHK